MRRDKDLFSIYSIGIKFENFYNKGFQPNKLLLENSGKKWY